MNKSKIRWGSNPLSPGFCSVVASLDFELSPSLPLESSSSPSSDSWVTAFDSGSTSGIFWPVSEVLVLLLDFSAESFDS